MNYGGLVPVTTNQTMITNVTAVQHVAYTDYDADGNAINQRNYLYVFGTGAGSIKYFAIVQIFGIMSTQPSTPTGVATVLPNLQVPVCCFHCVMHFISCRRVTFTSCEIGSPYRKKGWSRKQTSDRRAFLE